MERSSLVLLAALAVSGCALVPTFERETRVFVQRAAAYAFRIPDGWRPARSADYASVGFNRGILQRLDEPARAALLQAGTRELESHEIVLVSTRGAWIQVDSGPVTGARLRPGQRLDERERESLWTWWATFLRQTAPPSDTPRLSVVDMEVVEYGPNAALRVRYVAEVQRGPMRWTVLFLHGESRSATVAHVGTPEDANEGLTGLETVARSFRFE